MAPRVPGFLAALRRAGDTMPEGAPPRRLALALGLEPGTVRVRADAAAAALCADMRAPALTVGGTVWLGNGWRRAGARRRLAILAHELAHVAQQRRFRGGTSPASPEHAEAEAHACAAAALSGRARPPRLAIDPAQPACWGEAGHYYTVYFVLLAAGVPNEKALRAAFHCQMSDEIADLDAAERGFDILPRKDVFDLFWSGGALAKTRRMLEAGSNTYDGQPLTARDKDPYGSYLSAPKTYRYRRGGYDRDIFMALKVQMGLHALTGAPVEAETAKRVRIAMRMNPDVGPGFGLALHALGDSFAHRDGDRMYAPPVGHGLDGHEPDQIGPERARLYERYVRLLHGVGMRAFAGRQGSAALRGARLSADATVASLRMYMAYGTLHLDDTVHIGSIRQAATQDLKVTLHPYAPERTDSQRYGIFSGLKTPVTVTFNDLQTALRLAEEWSRAAGAARAADDAGLLEGYPIRL